MSIETVLGSAYSHDDLIGRYVYNLIRLIKCADGREGYFAQKKWVEVTTGRITREGDWKYVSCLLTRAQAEEKFNAWLQVYEAEYAELIEQARKAAYRRRRRLA